MPTSRSAAWGVPGQTSSIKFLLRQKDIPKLDLNYPKSEEEGVQFVAAIKAVPGRAGREEMTPPVRIAQLSCGPEYSGIQHEIDVAAQEVGGEIFFPDIALKDIRRDFDKFGLDVRSPDLKLAIARAMALVEGRVEADAVFIATCFRCAEAAIVRNELRRYITEHSKLPVVSYSFTERTTSGTLLTRMEALTTIARRRALLAREDPEGHHPWP